MTLSSNLMSEKADADLLDLQIQKSHDGTASHVLRGLLNSIADLLVHGVFLVATGYLLPGQSGCDLACMLVF